MVDISKRRICVLLIGALWFVLLFSANLIHFSSPYESYFLAANFRNSSPAYVNLLKARPSLLSAHSKTLRLPFVSELKFKSGVNELVKNHHGNLTDLTLRNVNTKNTSALRHIDSLNNTGSNMKVVDVNVLKNVFTNITLKSKVNDSNLKSAGQYNQNSSNNATSTNKQSIVNKDHDLLSKIAEDLKKSEFDLEERLDTIPQDVIQADKIIEIIDDEVNTSLIHENFIIAANIHDINSTSALINDEKLPKRNEVNVTDNSTTNANTKIVKAESNLSYAHKEILNTAISNNSRSSGIDNVGISQKENSRPGNNTADANLDQKEFNETVNNFYTKNQTMSSSLSQQNENHDEVKTVSNRTLDMASSAPARNRTNHGITKIEKESASVDRFIVDSNCSRGETSVEDILCMKRPQFLTDFLNPCWYQRGVLKCLPYFHIIGVCKTGTTDLFKRLSHHPQILKNRGLLGKETWYWTWRRYGHCNFYRSATRQTTFGNFIDHFDARAIGLVTRKQPNGTLYHPAVTGHGDPMDFWDHSSWKRIPQNDPSADVPKVNTPSLIKHVNPNVKLILILRDPIERLFSNYLHGPFGSTANDFHKDVQASLSLLDECTRNRTLKSCLYDERIIRGLKVPISGSFYSVHIKEWLKVFPRKQIYISRTQDLAKNTADTLLGIFRFLQLDPLPTKDLYRVANMPHYYNTKARETAGNIRAETRDILRHLFEPYNTELASILHDEKFNFNNVS